MVLGETCWITKKGITRWFQKKKNIYISYRKNINSYENYTSIHGLGPETFDTYVSDLL
jgi:hypothetical protein